MPPSPAVRHLRRRPLLALLAAALLLPLLGGACDNSGDTIADIKPATSQWPVAAKHARGQDYPAHDWPGKPQLPPKWGPPSVKHTPAPPPSAAPAPVDSAAPAVSAVVP